MKNLFQAFFVGILVIASGGSVFASGLPQANFIVSPAVGRVSSEFSLDARQSRNSAGNLGGVEIRYKLTSGGNWSEWTRRTVQTFTPMDTGTMRVSLQVRDIKTGQVQTTYRSIKVLSSWSRRAWISVEDYTAEVGQPVDFTLELSLQSFDNPDDVDIRWDFDSNGTWDTSFSRQKLVTHVFDKATTASPTAEVRFFDDEVLTVKGIAPQWTRGSRSIVPKTFWKKLKIVSPTLTAPVVDVRPGRIGFSEETTFVFDATSAKVPRGGWVEWSFDGQQWLRFPGKKIATHQFSSPGKHEIRTRVCMGYSKLKCEETTTEIEVEKNPTDYRVEISLLNRTNPQALTVRNAQQYVTVEVGDRIRFTAQLRRYSGAGQRYQYRWDFNDDGEWDTHFSTQSFTEHVYDRGGEFTVRVQVQNEDSVLVESSRRIFVDQNEKPVAGIGISKDIIYIGERVRFAPQFSGQMTQDRSRMEVRFDLDGDGLWESDFRGIGGQDWVFDTSGAVTIRMQIRDAGKNVTTVRKTIQVLPLPEVQARVVVSQRSGEINTVFRFDAGETTGEGVRYFWNFAESREAITLNDVYFGRGSQSSTVTHAWNTSGEKWILLTVVDVQGAVDQVIFPVEVESNPGI